MRDISNDKVNEEMHSISEENRNKYSVENSESMTVAEVLDAIKEKIQHSMNLNSREL